MIKKQKKVTLAYVQEIVDEFQASMTATLIKILNEDRFLILLVCDGKDKRH